MSTDRLVGKIEKKLRINDILFTITEYKKVINHHAGVIKLDEDFNMLELNNYVNLLEKNINLLKYVNTKDFVLIIVWPSIIRL